MKISEEPSNKKKMAEKNQSSSVKGERGGGSPFAENSVKINDLVFEHFAWWLERSK